MTLEVRQFNFSSYPAHLKYLHNYSWKIAICLKTMLEFDAIYYFDTSVTPLYDEEEQHYKSLAATVNDQMNKFKECYLFTLQPAGHTMNWATCSTMYDYIEPMNQTIWSPGRGWTSRREHKMEQAGGSAWLIRDKKCVMGLFLPLYLCAMEQSCIHPPQTQPSLRCNEKHLEEEPCLSACHRYDQSLTNLVVGNYYNFDKRRYTLVGRLNEKYNALNKISWKPEDAVFTHRSG